MNFVNDPQVYSQLYAQFYPPHQTISVPGVNQSIVLPPNMAIHPLQPPIVYNDWQMYYPVSSSPPIFYPNYQPQIQSTAFTNSFDPNNHILQQLSELKETLYPTYQYHDGMETFPQHENPSFSPRTNDFSTPNIDESKKQIQQQPIGISSKHNFKSARSELPSSVTTDTKDKINSVEHDQVEELKSSVVSKANMRKSNRHVRLKKTDVGIAKSQIQDGIFKEEYSFVTAMPSTSGPYPEAIIRPNVWNKHIKSTDNNNLIFKNNNNEKPANINNANSVNLNCWKIVEKRINALNNDEMETLKEKSSHPPVSLRKSPTPEKLQISFASCEHSNANKNSNKQQKKKETPISILKRPSPQTHKNGNTIQIKSTIPTHMVNTQHEDEIRLATSVHSNQEKVSSLNQKLDSNFLKNRTLTTESLNARNYAENQTSIFKRSAQLIQNPGNTNVIHEQYPLKLVNSQHETKAKTTSQFPGTQNHRKIKLIKKTENCTPLTQFENQFIVDLATDLNLQLKIDEKASKTNIKLPIKCKNVTKFKNISNNKTLNNQCLQPDFSNQGDTCLSTSNDALNDAVAPAKLMSWAAIAVAPPPKPIVFVKRGEPLDLLVESESDKKIKRKKLRVQDWKLKKKLLESNNTKLLFRYRTVLATKTHTVRRGKERALPKVKRLTPLKRGIINDRQARRAFTASMNSLKEKDEDKSSELTKTTNELIPSKLDSMPLPPQIPYSTSDDVINVAPPRFPELDEMLLEVLTPLVEFHDRAFVRNQEKKTKNQNFRRIVCGFREVSKHLKLSKVKFLVIAIDLEKGAYQIDQHCKEPTKSNALALVIKQIVDLAKERGCPHLLAFKRRHLQKLCHKTAPVSALAVINTAGAEDKAKNLLEKWKNLTTSV